MAQFTLAHPISADQATALGIGDKAVPVGGKVTAEWNAAANLLAAGYVEGVSPSDPAQVKEFRDQFRATPRTRRKAADVQAEPATE